MAVDVEKAFSQYENAPASEPMHGKAGEIRRNPSQDQKKVRRELSRKAELEENQMPETEASLLRKAAKAQTLSEQREYVAAAERLRTAKIVAADESRGLDLATAKINDTLVPGHVHELHTASTDWLLEVPGATASLRDAQHSLVAEASMWFGRVSNDVKSYPSEFAEQAKNKAHRLASQYGEHAPAAERAFLDEADRLLRQSVKLGKVAFIEALPELAEEAGGAKGLLGGVGGGGGGQSGPDMANGGDVAGVGDAASSFADSQLRTGSLARSASLEDGAHMMAHDLDNGGMTQIPTPAHIDPPGADESGLETHRTDANHPLEVSHERERVPFGFLRNHTGDTSDVHGMSHSFADSQLQRAARFSREANAKQDEAQAEALFGDDPYDDYYPAQRQAALTEVGATQGAPVNGIAEFPNNGNGSDTSSYRAPAIQEIQNFTGFDGASVVPVNDPGLGQADNAAQQLNDDTSGYQDASSNNPISAAGFPVGARLHHPVSKESHMSQEHAQCPTCGGQGKVAVRKMAYSGLPQVDQIVNADETPGATPLPVDVAFPITGWVPGVVEQTIGQAEQQIGSRPQGVGGAPGAPVGPGGSVAASRRTHANGRDNSGWAGDMGAKGIDYPGYSTPVGYDGSNNLGQPDPVYGFGGDQPNRPLKPYGAAEEDDFTNDPGQPYDPTSPHNNDRGQSTVSPAISTSGSLDPFIAAANEEIRRQQELIRTRTGMLSRQGR
jgi:hypothetical protein